ncbi:MAG: hypothetical protein ACI3XT_02770 [Butyricicoccaceae bacterium]
MAERMAEWTTCLQGCGICFIEKRNQYSIKIEKNDFKKKMAYAMLKTAQTSAVFAYVRFVSPFVFYDSVRYLL